MARGSSADVGMEALDREMLALHADEARRCEWMLGLWMGEVITSRTLWGMRQTMIRDLARDVRQHRRSARFWWRAIFGLPLAEG